MKTKAYSKFLSEHNFPAKDGFKNFSSIPITSKENYFKKYEFNELNKEQIPYLYYRSSGYSGVPTYWTQNEQDYNDFIEYMDFNLRYVFGVHKKRTLVISLFAMSSWITGQQVSTALAALASRYETLVAFACGMVVDEPLDMIKRFGHEFDQIIIFSYPLTFKQLVDESRDEGINLQDHNIFLVVGAEGVTYKWSKYYSSVLNKKGEEEYKVLSAYGTADTGIGIASEQRACLLLKDIVNGNPKILEDLLGAKEMPLHFFQYSPLDNFFEVVNDELIITKNKQMPLVRYNLHDKAKLIDFEKLLTVLGDHKIDFKKVAQEKDIDVFNLPLFAIYGRTDGTIILNGANVYINSFKEALDQDELINLHTGKFRVEKFEDESLFQNYKIKIELRPNIEPNERIRNELREEIIKFLLAYDKGYAAAYHLPFSNDDIGKIEFVDFSQENTLKHKYI